MSVADAPTQAGSARADATATPLSAYVHLPWCVKKCPYCDFNSHRAPATLPETAYVDALVADWAIAAAGERRSIDSVFIGGGTPSLFSAAAIERILETLADSPGLSADCEITLEANPGTTERSRFADLAAVGVNRISLGLQSLDSGCLAALGRIHGPEEALAAIDDVRSAGIDQLNCDLMFGLPGQDLDSGLADIETLLERNPGHISYYQLTLEPGTPFYRRPPVRPDDDTIADLFEAASERLTAAGYTQYEVSAWGRDHRCRHNDNYWRFGDYLGVGAGAHGKQTQGDGRILRTARQRWPAGYMQSAGTPAAIVETRSLEADDARFEALLNGLRRRQGLRRDEYEARTGLDWPNLLDTLAVPIERGLIMADKTGVRASPHGWYFLDSILAELV
ncbi:radical SAM family heme chaperone HemW [Salinisphaera sp. SPP-AMP-43]|uniref:radical SAM family heme chaperone HemW n=1 Tax=Salinisphaera sp. SPP-AMP-43 TaxID=3121288 RepID=UPI003C6E6287